MTKRKKHRLDIQFLYSHCNSYCNLIKFTRQFLETWHNSAKSEVSPKLIKSTLSKYVGKGDFVNLVFNYDSLMGEHTYIYSVKIFSYFVAIVNYKIMYPNKVYNTICMAVTKHDATLQRLRSSPDIVNNIRYVQTFIFSSL